MKYSDRRKKNWWPELQIWRVEQSFANKSGNTFEQIIIKRRATRERMLLATRMVSSACFLAQNINRKKDLFSWFLLEIEVAQQLSGSSQCVRDTVMWLYCTFPMTKYIGTKRKWFGKYIKNIQAINYIHLYMYQYAAN